jgi:hypothetical protein
MRDLTIFALALLAAKAPRRRRKRRCDLYVRNGDRLVLVIEDGDRFPVRP